eukprot:jgi/Mesvir1/19175/Mv25567-RA.1
MLSLPHSFMPKLTCAVRHRLSVDPGLFAVNLPAHNPSGPPMGVLRRGCNRPAKVYLARACEKWYPPFI